MLQVNMHEAKTHLSRLVDRMIAGEEVIIARAGKPVARLSSIEEAKKPPKGKFGFAKGRFTIAEDAFAPMTEEELALWYGD